MTTKLSLRSVLVYDCDVDKSVLNTNPTSYISIPLTIPIFSDTNSNYCDDSISNFPLPVPVTIPEIQDPVLIDDVISLNSSISCNESIQMKCGFPLVTSMLNGQNSAIIVNECRLNKSFFIDSSCVNSKQTYEGLVPWILYTLCFGDISVFKKTNEYTKKDSNTTSRSIGIIILQINEDDTELLNYDVSGSCKKINLLSSGLTHTSQSLNDVFLPDIPRILISTPEDITAVLKLLETLITLLHTELDNHIFNAEYDKHATTEKKINQVNTNRQCFVIIIECKLTEHDEQLDIKKHQYSRGILSSIPIVDSNCSTVLNSIKTNTISLNNSFFTSKASLSTLLRDKLKLFTSQDQYSLKDHNLHIEYNWETSHLLSFLYTPLFNNCYNTFMVGDIRGASYSQTIQALEILAAARQINSRRPIIEVKNNSKINEEERLTGTIIKPVCLREKRMMEIQQNNQLLRDALTCNSSLNEIELRLKDYSEPELQSSVSISTLKDHQIFYLKQLVFCLRKHLKYKDILEATADMFKNEVGSESLVTDRIDSDTIISDHSFVKQLNENSRAAVSFLSEQRRLLEILEKKMDNEKIEIKDEQIHNKNFYYQLPSSLRKITDIKILVSHAKGLIEEFRHEWEIEKKNRINHENLLFQTANKTVSEVINQHTLNDASDKNKLLELNLRTLSAENAYLQSELNKRNAENMQDQKKLVDVKKELLGLKDIIETQKLDYEKTVQRRTSVFGSDSIRPIVPDCFSTPWSGHLGFCSPGTTDDDKENDKNSIHYKDFPLNSAQYHTPAHHTCRKDTKDNCNEAVLTIQAAAENELFKLETEVMDLKNKLNDSYNSINQHVEQRNKDLETIQHLTQDISELTNDLEKLRAENVSTKLILQTTQTRLQDIQIDHQHLHYSATAKDAELELLRQEGHIYDTQKKEINKLKANINGLELALHHRISPEAVELLRHDAAVNKKLNDELTDQVTWTRKALQWNERQLVTAEAANKELREGNNQLTEQLQLQLNEIKTLKQSCIPYQDKIQTLQHAISTQTTSREPTSFYQVVLNELNQKISDTKQQFLNQNPVLQIQCEKIEYLFRQLILYITNETNCKTDVLQNIPHSPKQCIELWNIDCPKLSVNGITAFNKTDMVHNNFNLSNTNEIIAKNNNVLQSNEILFVEEFSSRKQTFQVLKKSFEVNRQSLESKIVKNLICSQELIRQLKLTDSNEISFNEYINKLKDVYEEFCMRVKYMIYENPLINDEKKIEIEKAINHSHHGSFDSANEMINQTLKNYTIQHVVDVSISPLNCYIDKKKPGTQLLEQKLTSICLLNEINIIHEEDNIIGDLKRDIFIKNKLLSEKHGIIEKLSDKIMILQSELTETRQLSKDNVQECESNLFSPNKNMIVFLEQHIQACNAEMNMSNKQIHEILHILHSVIKLFITNGRLQVKEDITSSVEQQLETKNKYRLSTGLKIAIKYALHIADLVGQLNASPSIDSSTLQCYKIELDKKTDKIHLLENELSAIEEKYHTMLTHHNLKQRIHHHFTLKCENAVLKDRIAELEQQLSYPTTSTNAQKRC